MCRKLGDFLLLYGSQTGQAKAIAENIAERTEKIGLAPRLHCMSGTEKQFRIEKERVAVIVLSTTGDGDFPDTASKFCRRLHKKDLPPDYLKDLSFALLGLGDTNHNNFCASPKKLDKRLLDLGATKFYESAFCDDAVGTELTAEPWMDNLLPALKNHLGMKDGDTSATVDGVGETRSVISEKAAESMPVQPKRSSVDHLANEFFSKCTLEKTDGLHGTDGNCGCVWPGNSLKFSDALSGIGDLKVPLMTAPYLAIEFLEEAEVQKLNDAAGKFQYPSQGSPVISCTLINRRQLTKPGAKKDKFEITIAFEAPEITYDPGDSFYFIVPNVPEEVEWLMKRLNLENMADKNCKIRVMENCTRKNAKVPAYLEQVHSVRFIFTNLVDVRRFVSKSALRYLAGSCTKMEEKRRLLELVSTQGAGEYEEFIRIPNLSILDVLHAFPSCAPSMERLLEYLPQLQPRPYSAASYDTAKDGKHQIRFVYSLVSIPAEKGRFYKREGLATSLLTALPVGEKARIFLKKPGKFRLLPEYAQCPLVMVGPGTGVAPFMGFLERIRLERQNDPSAFPVVHLFFGCRNEKLDFLFRTELEAFVSAGVLHHFHAAISGDNESSTTRYVQHLIKQKGEEMKRLILDEPVRIYVCGDAKHMAVDVFDAFCRVLVDDGGKEETEAIQLMRKMQEEGRYLQDVWT